MGSLLQSGILIFIQGGREAGGYSSSRPHFCTLKYLRATTAHGPNDNSEEDAVACQVFFIGLYSVGEQWLNGDEGMYNRRRAISTD